MRTPLALLAGLAALTTASHGALSMVISEYMYGTKDASGLGEFVEFTNVSGSAIDMTGWSFDDSSATAGSFSLSSLGVVQPGESVIMTDATAAAFRTAWGLAGTVNVIGGNTQNLGRADGINLFDSSNTLIDSLSFDDQTITGSFRTNGTSASGDPSSYGSHNSALFVASAIGQPNVVTSTGGDVGSPGFAVVPEASSLAISALAGLGFLRRRRA
ncbi:MAG: type 1 secretion target domain protein [Akkermansiaceae bacterium]|nr:type 1 secretion target domain protein [Akkermansiaceae bacterium]